MFELIETFEYYTENERKQKERNLILNIPHDIRLNNQIPKLSRVQLIYTTINTENLFL